MSENRLVVALAPALICGNCAARGIAVAVGTGALAGGILLDQTWLLVFGGVFLLEELYETGVVALVLRADC